ncbi:class I SAM-dependent methyltransferase [Streptomyces sp. NPDC058874]|uniref:class I SAM-dependent methyltransferase n=1 Tax=unclassified Streptomyces TaxID=2593676 RepID=UPI00368BF208
MTHATHHACGGDHPHGPGAASYPDFAWDDLYTGDGSDTADPDPALLAPADHLPPGRALDLGCGAGGNALALAERGWRVTAVDLAPRAIASTRASACARGLDGRIELAVADSASWQPESAPTASPSAPTRCRPAAPPAPPPWPPWPPHSPRAASWPSANGTRKPAPGETPVTWQPSPS